MTTFLWISNIYFTLSLTKGPEATGLKSLPILRRAQDEAGGETDAPNNPAISAGNPIVSFGLGLRWLPAVALRSLRLAITSA